MSVCFSAPASGVAAIPDPTVDVWKVIARAFRKPSIGWPVQFAQNGAEGAIKVFGFHCASCVTSFVMKRGHGALCE